MGRIINKYKCQKINECVKQVIIILIYKHKIVKHVFTINIQLPLRFDSADHNKYILVGILIENGQKQNYKKMWKVYNIIIIIFNIDIIIYIII